MRHITELHFQNSARIVPGSFSCAVDCFLEIWFRKISPYIGLCDRGTFSYLLNEKATQYLLLGEQFKRDSSHKHKRIFLHELQGLRSGIWEFLRFKCTSFFGQGL